MRRLVFVDGEFPRIGRQTDGSRLSGGSATAVGVPVLRLFFPGRGFVLLTIMLAAGAFVSAACLPNGGVGKECNVDGDCPLGQVCLDGICFEWQSGPGSDPCATDEDCPEGYCDAAGICQTGERPENGPSNGQDCEQDEDCPDGERCDDGVCKASADPDCETAFDCDYEEICQDGSCEPFTDARACSVDTDCPADHVCNMGHCEGCINDQACAESLNGPKCALTDDEPAPRGYCYVQCGPKAEVEECPSGYLCDEGMGGYCIPACYDNEDCTGGFVCDLDTNTCGPCTHDDQCEDPQTCNTQGVCVDPPTGCVPEDCDHLGDAYYCDEFSGACRLGCTFHSEGQCHGADEPWDCNPCPGGWSCDTSTGNCEGYGDWPCDCAPLDCGSLGKFCNIGTCECLAPPIEKVGRNHPCVSDEECEDGLVCFEPFMGGQTTCQIPCCGGLGNSCPSGESCHGPTGKMDFLTCLAIEGYCVPD